MERKREQEGKEPEEKAEKKDSGIFKVDAVIVTEEVEENKDCLDQSLDATQSFNQVSASPRVRLMEAKVMDESFLAGGGDFSGVDDNIGSIVGDTLTVDMLIKQVWSMIVEIIKSGI